MVFRYLRYPKIGLELLMIYAHNPALIQYSLFELNLVEYIVSYCSFFLFLYRTISLKYSRTIKLYILNMYTFIFLSVWTPISQKPKELNFPNFVTIFVSIQLRQLTSSLKNNTIIKILIKRRLL